MLQRGCSRVNVVCRLVGVGLCVDVQVNIDHGGVLGVRGGWEGG